MPTKGTSLLTSRVKDDVVAEIKKRAKRRGITINAWLNWAISQGIRKHVRKDGQIIMSGGANYVK